MMLLLMELLQLTSTLILQLKTGVVVGVVGFPNVGKSSLINSLKRTRVASVGATPGVTKAMQEIHLDKHVKLLDCPGIVFASPGDNEASATLRNCTKVERLADPITPGQSKTAGS
jgi:nuclear GTP-binding protein